MSFAALSAEIASPDPPPLNVTAEPAGHAVSPWLLALLLAALTLLAYWPTFSNGFLNYDDNGYVTQNSHVQAGLTLANVAWAFRATIMANWHPLTWISHMADVQLFGLHPAGHHAVSLLLHIVNVVLLFFLLSSATGFVWRSFTVAALFALHPFNVECVAWVAERKSLLCTFFLFLALFAYGWYVRRPGVARYLLVALLFALGLASKPMIITLPFALLVLDFWPLQRIAPSASRHEFMQFLTQLKPLVREKIPLLLLVAASAWVTVLAQALSNTIALGGNLAFPVRAANAFWSYLLYLLKGLWPLHLTLFYPHPENTLPLWKPLAGILAILAITYFCLSNLRKRYLLAGWLWYLGCLVPVIGFIQVGRQSMADRYAYTPLVGIFVALVWWLADVTARWRHRSELLVGLSAIFLLFFGVLTWRQTTYWKDSVTVFQHALEVTPVNFIAENNLGEAYIQAGRPDLAYDHFFRSAQQKPRFGLAHYNLGILLAQDHRRDDARKEFQLAVRYAQDRSDVAAAYHNLGIVDLEDNQLTEAVDMFNRTLELAPWKQNTYLARGMAEFRLYNFAAAETDFMIGANLAPDPPARFWLGRAREAQGNTQGAIEAYRKTLQMQPDMREAKERLDNLLSGRSLPFARSEN